jgi:dTDP-4-amino-4,6-dideoxygalactose transaminase
VGLFSLGPGKPLSTGGGGILCTNDEVLIRRLERSCRLPPPALAAAWMPVRLALLALVFRPTGWWLATRLGLHRLGDSEAAGGYTLAGLAPAQAALGLALLPRLEAINRRRRENAARLIARLRGLDFVHLPAPAEAAEPVYLRLPVIIDSAQRREQLFGRLWAAGIGAGRMYRQALPQLFPSLASEPYPGAEAVAQRLLTLPTHPYLTPADVERIGRIFETFSEMPRFASGEAEESP